LEGLVKYGNNKSATSSVINDTIPKSEKASGNGDIKIIDVQLEDVMSDKNQSPTKQSNQVNNDASVKIIDVELTDTVPKEKNQKTFTKVEIEAEYSRDKNAWADYLQKNLNYPQEAVNKEIQGTVIAQFIVELDGTLSDMKIVKSPNKLLSDETLRTIKNSGKWIPAVQNGKQVRAYKRQPIVFKLDRQ
jgi:TonB family protein